VIESIFGKYKSDQERSPSPGLGANVRQFSLFVTRITPELVVEAWRAVTHRLIRRLSEGLCGSSHRRLRLELRPPPLGTIPT
jgi:hypothetical protein